MVKGHDDLRSKKFVWTSGSDEMDDETELRSPKRVSVLKGLQKNELLSSILDLFQGKRKVRSVWSFGSNCYPSPSLLTRVQHNWQIFFQLLSAEFLFLGPVFHLIIFFFSDSISSNVTVDWTRRCRTVTKSQEKRKSIEREWRKCVGRNVSKNGMKVCVTHRKKNWWLLLYVNGGHSTFDDERDVSE